MRLLLCATALGMGLFGSAGPGRAAPLTEDDFQVRSTGDLVALCSAEKTDPLYTPAVNFCHGFAVGTYSTLVDVQRALRGKKKMFCLPATPPSRNEGIAAFVQWAGQHNDQMALAPINGVLKFLTQQYPCG